MVRELEGESRDYGFMEAKGSKTFFRSDQHVQMKQRNPIK